MSWRVVFITNRCKLDYCMNYMVVRGKETKRVFLDEVAVLMIESNAVSMTANLLSVLMDKKIKVIFCDAKHSPQSELVPLYGAHNDVIKIKQQIQWDNEVKREVWTCIVKEKIRNQAKLLKKLNHITEHEMILG